MFVTSGFRKMRRVHYSLINTIVPFKSARWGLTGCTVLAYIATTRDVCADLNTYLVGFYLLMLLLNYFLPRGLAHDIEVYDEE